MNCSSGGERGIRTPGPLTRSTVFKTAALDRSAISPGAKLEYIFTCAKYLYILFVTILKYFLLKIENRLFDFGLFIAFFRQIINKNLIFINKNAFFLQEHLLNLINTLYLYVYRKIIFTNPKNFLL